MHVIDFKTIKSMLHNKKEVCIFVGAGASIMPPSSLPSFQELNNALLLNLCNSTSKYEELQSCFKKIDTKPEQLLQIIWDYTNGGFNPIESFQHALPNQNHHLIAELIAQGINCIVTPNFDSCIEKALDKRHITYELFNRTPITNQETHHLLSYIKSKKIVIWKPHGDCRQPETLCYTRTKVAKLSNSCYLREVLSYIIQNYYLLFLGYSGYDDDIFPILYEMLPSSKKHVIWNAYKKPSSDEPCLSLQNISPENFHFWVGDMKSLLLVLSGRKTHSIDQKQSIDWNDNLEKQLDTVAKSTKIAILAKYLNDFSLTAEAQNIWSEGLNLPDKQKTDEDSLRFQMNLKMISYDEAYRKALKEKYYYIAEIALANLILESISAKDSSAGQSYLIMYLQNCTGVAQNFFRISKYYRYLYIYKLELIGENALHLKADFERAYQALSEDGEIVEAINLMIKHYASIAAQNQGNLDILKESIMKVDQLTHYGESSSIANAYYFIANLAITIGKYDIALTYHQKCYSMMELFCANKYYQEDQCHELWSCIYHQSALLAQNRRFALEKEQLALSEAEMLQDEMKKNYHRGFIYNTMCSLYMRDNYELAIKYGMQALKFGQIAGSLQIIARSYAYLAVADANHGLRENAIQKFKKSYAIHIQICEGLGSLYSLLEESKIDISELNDH